MTRIALLIAACAVLSGCDRSPSYAEAIASRPIPVTQDERDHECDFLRSNIARQQSLATMPIGTMNPSVIQAIASQHIAALENRVSVIGCRSAFPDAPAAQSTIDQCVVSCRSNTSRTSEQCFDSCNR